MSDSFAGLSVAEFGGLVAGTEPAPGGGAVAAVSAGLAAGLVAMAARFSTAQLPDHAQRAGRADELRITLLELADTDAAAYREVLAAYRLPGTDPDRARAVTDALRWAADVPLRIAEIAAEIAEAAADLAALGNRNLRGDARTAALHAEAAASSAADLVAINVRAGALSGELTSRAQSCVDTAAAATRRCVGQVWE